MPTTPQFKQRLKLAILLLLFAIVTLLHYSRFFDPRLQEIFVRDLFLAPMLLGAFWFRLSGALVVGLLTTAALTPAIWHNLQSDPYLMMVDGLEIALYFTVGLALGLLRDRERRQLRQIRQAESLAAMGRAVSALAHDMKTPLIAIGGFAAQVRRHLPDQSPDACKLDIVIGQTRRLELMVREMLDFSRPVRLNPAPIDPTALVEETLLLAEPLAAKGQVRLRSQCAVRPNLLLLDRDHLQRALLNLLANAVQASPIGSEVLVSLSCHESKPELRLEVSDQGHGIPAELRTQVFSPFFTTKREGTGLGLAIARKIIEAHGGRLEMRDNQPRGMVFSLVLPLTLAQPPA
ncbi:MAG: hypothetical protein LDL11_03700 [Desulfarculus sp.]|nr:hypothetical protein [Desulfarculus sp.]